MPIGVGVGAGRVKVGVGAAVGVSVGEGVGEGSGVGVSVGVWEGTTAATGGDVGVAVLAGISHGQLWIVGQKAQIAAKQTTIPTMALIPFHLEELSISENLPTCLDMSGRRALLSVAATAEPVGPSDFTSLAICFSRSEGCVKSA